MQKILFVCNDFIGKTMAGPGIRYWELALALERKGHHAVILSRHLEKGFSGEGVTFVGRSSFLNLAAWVGWSDCVIQPGSPLAILFSLLLRKQVMFDQYDPVIFEFLELEPSTVIGKIRKRAMLFLWKIRQRLILRFGSAFLVANEKQKDFLIGQMAGRGYMDKLDSVVVLPFGLPESEPVTKHAVLRGTKIKETDFLLLWGGGIWDWFDPFTLLHALAKIGMQRDDIKVYFPGLKPPSPGSHKLSIITKFLNEAESAGLLGNAVFVNTEWTSYDRRADYLLEANAGISLHRDSLETRFAFRTRMLDYLWAGLPIIASKGDCWADVIEKRGLGITIASGDVDGLAQAIITMADDTAFRNRCRENVRAIAEAYAWDALVTRLTLDPDRNRQKTV